MAVEIKHRFTGTILFKSETAESMREALIGAVRAGANLAGADLADADLADADLAGANLAGADLADAYLADANLADANLARANLAGADLADAYLAGANLADANLARANLAGADLADARNVPDVTAQNDPVEPYERKVRTDADRAADFRARHPEVPVVENLDAKILGVVESGEGKLEMGDWHACETTHCRGGWAIHFAGAAGYELERKVGVLHASRLIYRASTGRVPHFFASNEGALEDIKACAAKQAEPSP